MPTIEFVTKISEEGVISTFESIAKSIEGSAEAADHLGEHSADASGKMNVEWSEVGKTFAITGAAIAGAGVSVVGSLFEMAEKTSVVGTQMDLLSQRTGLTTEMLSQLSFAAVQEGVSIENVTTGLRLLATHMENAQTKGGAAAETFVRLGVSAIDASGNLRPTSEVLLDVADKFSHMSDGAEKSALAVQLFGRGGLALIPILNQGRDGIADFAAQADRLGIVFSEEAAKKAHEFEDSLNTLYASVQGLTRTIGEGAYPTLERWIGRLTDAVVATKDWARTNPELSTSLLEMAAVMVGGGGVLLGLGSMIVALPTIIGYIGTFASVTEVATVSTGLLGEAIVGTSTEVVAASGILGQLQGGLGLVVESLTGPVGIAIGLAAAAAGLIYLIDKTESGHAAILSIIDVFKEWASGIVDAAQAFGGFVEEIARIAWEEISVQVSAIGSAYHTMASTIKDATGGFLNFAGVSTPAALGIIGKSIEDSLLGPWSRLKLLLEENKDAMKQFTDQGGPAALQPMTLAQVLLTAKIDDTGKSMASTTQLSAFQQEALKKHKEAVDSLTDSLIPTAEKMSILNEAIERQVVAGRSDTQLLAIFGKAAEEMGQEAIRAGDHVDQLTGKFWVQYEAQKVIAMGQKDLIEQEKQNRISASALYTKLAQDDLDIASYELQGLRSMDNEYANGKTAKALSTFEFMKTLPQAELDNQIKVDGDALVERLKASDAQLAAATKLGNDISREWTSAMNQMDKAVSSAFADMIVHWQFNADALVNIAQSTSKSMLSAFLDGMIKPLTNELASLGTQFSDYILGIDQHKNDLGQVVGYSQNGGGVIGLIDKIPGVGGGLPAGHDMRPPSGVDVSAVPTFDDSSIPTPSSGGTDAVGSAGTIASGEYAGTHAAGLLSTVGSVAAAAGVAYAEFSLAKQVFQAIDAPHFTANELTKNIQGPFDTKFAATVNQLGDALNSGHLDLGTAQSLSTLLRTEWNDAGIQVQAFANQGVKGYDGQPIPGTTDPRNQVVANQFFQTEYPFVKGWLDWADGVVASVRGYATGTDYVPSDGMYMLHQGEGVRTAAQNTGWRGGGDWNGGGGNSVTLTIQNVNISGESKDPRKMAQDFMTEVSRNGEYRQLIQRIARVQI